MYQTIAVTRSVRSSDFTMRIAAAKKKDPASTTRAPGPTAPAPGRVTTRTPSTPPTMAAHRGRVRRSRRKSAARRATHTGLVNSMAVTTASGARAMPHTQEYWPQK